MSTPETRAFTTVLDDYTTARKRRDEAEDAVADAKKKLDEAEVAVYEANQKVLNAACAIYEERRLREERKGDKHM